MPIAVIENDTVYYIRTDHIGRPFFATDDAGTVVWEASYLPFGGVHTTTGTPIDLRFPGQWFQSESGLHQNWMRNYDPTTGRYIQADPLGLVDGASVYGYALQNPMVLFDSDGQQSTNHRTGHRRGGPYHPPRGVRTRCRDGDSCPLLRGKLFVLNRMINSHMGFDRYLGYGRHSQEIADLKRAASRCQRRIAKNCSNCPPGSTVPVPVVPVPNWRRGAAGSVPGLSGSGRGIGGLGTAGGGMGRM